MTMLIQLQGGYGHVPDMVSTTDAEASPHSYAAQQAESIELVQQNAQIHSLTCVPSVCALCC